MALFSRRVPGGEPYALRVLLVSLALIYSITASGVVFGYSGIFSVLVYDVKAFVSLCPPDTAVDALPCPAQASALSLMYTVGATTSSGCAFFVGLFLDGFGPRITICLGSLLLGSGLALVAFAQEFGDSLYYWGFFVMAVGGPCIFNSTYSFGELFPFQSSAIIGALSTGFNSSTVILTVFSWIISTYAVSFKTVFLAYTLLPTTIFFTSLFLFPDEPFSASASGGSHGKVSGNGGDQILEDGEEGGTPRFSGELQRVWTLTLASEAKYPADVEGYSAEYPDSVLSKGSLHNGTSMNHSSSLEEPLLGKSIDEEAHATPLYRRRRSFLFDDGPPRIYNTSFLVQISSPIFWTMAVFTAFVVLRVNYYIETLYSQLLYVASRQHPGDPNSAIAAATFYSALFNIMLPPGGIMMIPIVGYVMVELGFVPTFLVIATLHLLFCTVNCLQFLPVQVQVVSFVLYSSLRPFVFGGMAAYIGRIFGFVNFGKLYGLVRVTGAFAVSLEFFLESLTIHFFGGNYLYVNLGFLVLGLGLFAFPIYLWKQVFYGYFFRPPIITIPRQ